MDRLYIDSYGVVWKYLRQGMVYSETWHYGLWDGGRDLEPYNA